MFPGRKEESRHQEFLSPCLSDAGVRDDLIAAGDIIKCVCVCVCVCGARSDNGKDIILL